MNLSLSQAIAFRFNITLDGWIKTWVSIPCPLHQDNTASAGLNFEEKMFNCLAGCGGLPFHMLADKLDIKYNGDYVEEDTTDWLNNLIEDNTPVKKKPLKVQAQQYADFLISKKLNPETIEELGGRYVNDVTDPDYGHLVVEYERGKSFRRRIIGATEDTKHRNRKGENRAFLKSNTRSSDSVILCEGFTDYATLYQIGYRSIAATLGASVTKKDLYNLRGKSVFILFDRDYAGYEGSRQAAKLLREFDSIPIILEIPERFRNEDEGKIDINSAYCFDSSGFTDWLEQSIKRFHIFDSSYVSDVFLRNARTVRYVPSGIPSFDGVTNGGFATGLHAIAGMPGVGKSTLKTYLIDTFEAQGNRVLCLDYELTKEQNYARLASRRSKHSWSDIEKDHSIVETETAEYLNKLSKSIRIENDWTIEQILIAAKNFEIIIADYVQRMPYTGDDERAGIKYNCRQFSNLARDNGKIVILYSSIPRSMYDKSGKAVFKETGDIEYIIASGWLLSKIMPDVMEMKCLKNTRGPEEDVNIYLNTEYAHQRIKEQLKPELRGILG
jgi:5S rRNA maturation endonuclease (ribonuclease M5)